MPRGGDLTLIGLKLVLTPVLIAALTLVARARGSRVAGLVVGLPLTSGPVSAFLAVENGAAFSARAAVGAIDGLAGVQVFCAAYVLCARRASWPWSLLAGTAACACAVAVLQLAPRTLVTAATGATLLAVVLAALAPRLAGGRGQATAPCPAAQAAPPWDLPMRMIVATALVLVLTLCARYLGPAWSGALSSLPVFTAVLAAFTHHRNGSVAAVTMLGAAIIGTVGGVAFFAIVGALLAPGAMIATYVLATAAARRSTERSEASDGRRQTGGRGGARSPGAGLADRGDGVAYPRRRSVDTVVVRALSASRGGAAWAGTRT